MTKRFKDKRGSEVIQTLIVIAIMGILAVTAVTGLSNKIGTKSDSVGDTVVDKLGDAENYPGK